MQAFIVVLLLINIILCAFIAFSILSNKQKHNHQDYDKLLLEQQKAADRLQNIDQSILLNTQNSQIGFREARQENTAQSRALREEVSSLFENGMSNLTRSWSEQSRNQNERLQNLGDQMFSQLLAIQKSNQEQQDKINDVLSQQLKNLQDSNEKKLEQMRLTVDEKLNDTLEKRLESSFKQVGDQLERVYKSLGEMQNLSSGVTELQRVLTNVKARGTWAEVQLENLLQEVLTADQYQSNVAVKKNSQQRVDFAVKLPGRDENGKHIWLPIDSKFPQEDYLRILDASEAADAPAVEAAGKQLEMRIMQEARSIRDKYINPPETTDFAILYLPTEGLYAEVLRRSGVAERIQRECRITLAGPTTLLSMLNALNMGFRTLAVEKRSSDVWKLLGVLKQQYSTFSTQLAKAQKKISEAGKVVDDAAKRTETINTKLKKVEIFELDSDNATDQERELFSGLQIPDNTTDVED